MNKKTYVYMKFAENIILALISLFIVMIFMSYIVYADVQSTQVTIQTGSGFCSVSTPTYFTNLDCNNNMTTNFVVSHNFTNTSITYNVLGNYTLITGDDLLDDVLFNFSCNYNATSENVSAYLEKQRNDIAADLNLLLTRNVIPAQERFDAIKLENDEMNKTLLETRMELNITQINLYSTQQLYEQTKSERDRAYIYVVVVLVICAAVVISFGGIIKWNKPKVQ